MDVRLKRVYEPVDETDGYRVLVDRLRPRGVSRERARLDDWERGLDPSAGLRTWFGHECAARGRVDGGLGQPARGSSLREPSSSPGSRGAGVAVLRRSEGLELLEEVGEETQCRPGPRRRCRAGLDGARAAWPLEGSGTRCLAVGPRDPDVVDVGCRGGCLGPYAAAVAS